MALNLDYLARAVESFEKLNNGIKATAIRMSQQGLKDSWDEVSKDKRFKGLVFSMDTNIQNQCVIERPLIPVVIQYEPNIKP